MAFGIAACGENLNGKLLESASAGDSARVKVLLSKGANPNAKNIYGWPVLMKAVGGGNTEVVKLLLDHGAAANAGNSWERTALHEAARRGNLEIAGNDEIVSFLADREAK